MSERVRLPRPIRAGGRTITEVVVRRPDGKDKALLGEILATVANHPDDPEDQARARRLVAAHLSDLGVIAFSIEDDMVLQPVVDQVFHYMTRDEN